MIKILADFATTKTRAFTPALFEVPELGASFQGRRMSAGCVAVDYGITVPAFLEDTFPGVRAWSPPV
jgi:hypothetical protein